MKRLIFTLDFFISSMMEYIYLMNNSYHSTQFFFMGFLTTLVTAFWISLFNPIMSTAPAQDSEVLFKTARNLTAEVSAALGFAANSMRENAVMLSREVSYQFVSIGEILCEYDDRCITDVKHAFGRINIIPADHKIIAGDVMSLYAGLYSSRPAGYVLGASTNGDARNYVEFRLDTFRNYTDRITFGLVSYLEE